MYYFTNCHKVPDGELIVLFSMELLFSVSILHDLCTYEKKVSEAVNTVPIEAYNDFMKDVSAWNHYKLSYNNYMTNIIDVLIVEQERAMINVSKSNVSVPMDTFTEMCVCDGVDLVSSASNIDGFRDNYSSDIVTSSQNTVKFENRDVNVPDKDRGFLGLSDRSFSFIGPDRQPVVMDSIQEYIKAADIIKSSGVPNYQQARIHVTSNLNISAWERYLQNYPDQLLIQYLKFGFPLSLHKGNKLHNDNTTNHFSANQFPEAVDECYGHGQAR